jgi:hypothetical protein
MIFWTMLALASVSQPARLHGGRDDRWAGACGRLVGHHWAGVGGSSMSAPWHPENSHPPEDREAVLRAQAEAHPEGPEGWWRDMLAKLRQIVAQSHEISGGSQ